MLGGNCSRWPAGIFLQRVRSVHCHRPENIPGAPGAGPPPEPAGQAVQVPLLGRVQKRGGAKGAHHTRTLCLQVVLYSSHGRGGVGYLERRRE